MVGDPNFSWPAAYERDHGRVYITGVQALVRLPLMQRRCDRARGLSTAGLISGYRGSPLGGYDQQLWRAASQLKAHNIVFQPGLNEDLAATALWGAQMHRAFGSTTVDGVFGMWYGKGPGVDRSGDVFRNANIQGTAPLGGVIACIGDDHAAQSSMFPHQTDGILVSVGMPILQPATVPELLSMGLAAFALSRFSGLWVGLKTLTDVVECAGSFELPEAFPSFVMPPEFVISPHGLNWDPRLRWPEERAELERRLVEERLPAARAWSAANHLDHSVLAAPRPRLGLVTVGKAHQDLMQALADLGLNSGRLLEQGVSVYKVGMSWPLALEPALVFADGLEELLVVEEKRGIVEGQLKEALYHLPANRRPRISGKFAPDGQSLLPETLDVSPHGVARALVARFGDWFPEARAAFERYEQAATAASGPVTIDRKPFFCAGCPHNTSLQTPPATRSGGGIGCHVMALGEPELRTATFSQMGGEGLQWVGAAPFVSTPHLFQNLGDGTYQHSGLLAIRAAVAAHSNVTFKILYNDAVAMTGGQLPDGDLDPLRVARQLYAEGVRPVVLVSEDPKRWRAAGALPPDIEILHRDGLMAVQNRLALLKGVSAIVYEQTCASEKRRRRKRGTLPEPQKRLYINPKVCEGCGDCSVQSRCIAIEPVETEYGRKRKINQSSCNKDYSCLRGFCPSFVELEGAVLREPDARAIDATERILFEHLPQPSIRALAADYNIYVAGVGGTGVLTLGALLGVAAHLEGLASTVLDYTGLAQKNGAVVSQIRLARTHQTICSPKISPAAVDLLIGADLVTSAAARTLTCLSPGRSAAVINATVTPTAHIVADRDAAIPVADLQHGIFKRTDTARRFEVDAGGLSEALFGDGVFANTMMLGFAWQKGLLPLRRESIECALTLNGVAVESNVRAFNWGRAIAHDPAAMREHTALGVGSSREQTLEALIESRAGELRRYQNARYAERYRAAIQKLRPHAGDAVSHVAAHMLYRLMAYKDEYEVARLYTDSDFAAGMKWQFASHRRVSVWLAPPFLTRKDPATGRPRKRRFGPWVFVMFRILAMFSGLRGTVIDPFGYTTERRKERQLVEDYLTDLETLAAQPSDFHVDHALALVRWPDAIRGFGSVKLESIEAAQTARSKLWTQLRTSARAPINAGAYRAA